MGRGVSPQVVKILIVQTGFLGDVILSTPVIEAVKSLYPEAQITFLTTPAAQELIQYNPQVSETWVFDKRNTESGISGFFKMRARILAGRFDIVFSLHKSFRTSLLLWASGIPVRYGFSEAKGSFLYTRTAARSDGKHDVLRNLSIMRNVNREPHTFDGRLSVALSPESISKAKSLLSSFASGPLIGIAPGSVWLTKRWPEEHFKSVVDELLSRGANVVLLGGPDEKQLGEFIEGTKHERLLNLIGKTDLLTSAAVISQLGLLLTNDSAPLHLASAYRIPTVALFCATVPEFGFGPWQTFLRNFECRQPPLSPL